MPLPVHGMPPSRSRDAPSRSQGDPFASVAENPQLTWPTRFAGKPGVHILRSTAQVIEVATAE